MGVAMGHHDEHGHEEHPEVHDHAKGALHGKPELATNPANAPG
jgi:hypothetical protein